MVASGLRVKFLAAFFLLASVLILSKLFSIQVLKSDEFLVVAKSQYQTSKTIPARRGSILASDGFPLVTFDQIWLLWATVAKIENPQRVAKTLAPLIADKIDDQEAADSVKLQEKIISQEEDRIKKVLTREGASWVPIKHKIKREIKEEIEKLDLAGIGFDPEDDRSYPEGTMAARLLGFVGKDDAGESKGYFGLEGFYDLALSGSRGTKAWEKDAFGNTILFGSNRKFEAMDGMDLKTNIDRSVQFIIERHLEKGIKKYDAVSGLAVVIRPIDGAILALSSVPAYDPAKFSKYESKTYIDPIVGESFEPGSIFKVLVMAAALDSGVIKQDSKCDKCSGPRIIGEYTIDSGTNEYYPNSTLSEIIEHSDNVGMVWVSEKMGVDRLYNYLLKYGFGLPTGIDLQGEASLPLRKKEDWSFIDLATASFGQGIAVTPIQMVRAVSVIANEGKLPVPRVVEKISSGDKDEIVKYPGSQQVISPRAARLVTDMMVGAVESRSNMWFKPKDIKVAGKTGTAQVPIAGHYDPDKTIASFIGFAPADDPKFVMLVILREPKSAPWASQTVAPLWFSIANDLFPYMGIQPK